jgi:hypothetical protein
MQHGGRRGTAARTPGVRLESPLQSPKELAMCYAYEQEYWLRRAEEIRKEMQKAEERLKQKPAPAPAKPAAPDSGVEQPDPVPA